MDVTAKSRFVRVSPTKARDLARSIQGLTVDKALQIVNLSNRKAAVLIGKTLKSAIANAENNAEMAVDELVVKQAVVDDGPRLRRYWPRARGSVSPIRRRLSNIKVVLTDGKDEEKKEK